MKKPLLAVLLLSACSQQNVTGPAVKFPSCLFACNGHVAANDLTQNNVPIGEKK